MAKKLWCVQTGTGRSVTAALWALLMLGIMLGLPAVAAAMRLGLEPERWAAPERAPKTA